MSATIKYKGNTIVNITTNATKTLKTGGKYCEGDIIVENVQDGGSDEQLIKLFDRTVVTFEVPNGAVRIGTAKFYFCTDLESVTIPSTVTTIESSAFYYCTKLSSITIPSGVTSIDGTAFMGCSSLKSITIPSGVTKISSYCFQSSGLESITIPSGVTTIESGAFNYCASLQKIRFEAQTPPTMATDVFTSLPTSCVISVPIGKLSAYTSASGYPSSATYTYIEE